MTTRINAALFAGTLLASQLINAAPLVDWGTGAESGTSTCASFALPSCGVTTSPIEFGPEVDNYQGASADSTITSAKGTAEANALLTAVSGISTPELRAKAQGTEGVFGVAGRGSSRAWALEGYTYSGPNTTIDLLINLTGTITNPDNRSFTGINAYVGIFDAADFSDFGPDGFGSTDLSGYIGEGFFPLDEANLGLFTGGPNQADDVLQLALSDGDQFYVWAQLGVGGANGAIADAMSTLSLSFSNNNGLTSASGVPLPAAVWLLGAAFAGLMGTSRRRSVS